MCVLCCVVLKVKVVGGESLAHKEDLEEKSMVGIWAFGKQIWCWDLEPWGFCPQQLFRYSLTP